MRLIVAVLLLCASAFSFAIQTPAIASYVAKCPWQHPESQQSSSREQICASSWATECALNQGSSDIHVIWQNNSCVINLSSGSSLGQIQFIETLKCPEGSSLSGRNCVFPDKPCPSGQLLIDGQCQPPNCPEGTTYNESAKACFCPDGLEPINGKCKKDCEPDEEEWGGQCLKKCKPGEERDINGVCKPKKCVKDRPHVYPISEPVGAKCENGCVVEVTTATVHVGDPTAPSAPGRTGYETGATCNEPNPPDNPPENPGGGEPGGGEPGTPGGGTP
ncbi:MAG: hypothetical protein Q4G71_13705, partial [Pseudomonadota bacterium]|nr:hypothetical protein [Pseudomonadota bacterium]